MVGPSVISVALCTRDGERYLEDQLMSILEGSRRPDEIVVSDDGSQDGTVAVARRVLEADGIPHVIVVNDPALGVTANFEAAISATSGDLVVLSDQDDVWECDRLAVAVEVFERDPRALLHHSDAELVDASNVSLGVGLFDALAASEADLSALPTSGGFDVLLRRNLVTGATTAFRRELLDLARPFPAEWVHDEWLAVLAASRDGIATERRRLVRYRQHGRNQIGMRRRGLATKIRRVTENDRGRLARLVVRAELLAERLSTSDAPSARVARARDKVEFERARSDLPRMRIARLAGVLRLARAGGYRRYASQGRLDVLRDLLQPR